MSDKKNTINWLPIIISIGMTLLIFCLLSVYLQKTVFRVIITGDFADDAQVVVSSINAAGETLWSENFTIQSDGYRTPELAGTKTINKPIHRLRLEFLKAPDLSDEPSHRKIVIHNIQIPMPYSVDYFYGVAQIGDYFSSAQAIPDHSGIFEYDNNKIRLESNDAIGSNNLLLTLGMSLLFGLGIWLITKNSQWSSIPAFADMSLGNRISSSAEFDSINGIRGLAALLVLFSHTAPGFAVNQMGLALLFIISGFLLAKPFIIDPNKIYSWANIERYLTKRLKRILPMYYLFVFITFVLSFQFDTAIRHFLFIQAKGHLWPMTQIFTFYMLLPIALLITCFLYRLNRYLPIIFLTLASYFWNSMASGWMPYFNGEYSHPFFLYTFLMGVLISYLYYDLIINSEKLAEWQRQYNVLFAAIALSFTVLVIAWSAPVQPPAAIAPYMSAFFVKSILAAGIVILALFTAKTWFAKLMSNWLFRSVGVIGFSFYLLHSLGMQIAEKLNQHVLHIDAIAGRSWGFCGVGFQHHLYNGDINLLLCRAAIFWLSRKSRSNGEMLTMR